MEILILRENWRGMAPLATLVQFYRLEQDWPKSPSQSLKKEALIAPKAQKMSNFSAEYMLIGNCGHLK
jgi:hypothetical protein